MKYRGVVEIFIRSDCETERRVLLFECLAVWQRHSLGLLGERCMHGAVQSRIVYGNSVAEELVRAWASSTHGLGARAHGKREMVDGSHEKVLREWGTVETGPRLFSLCRKSEQARRARARCSTFHQRLRQLKLLLVGVQANAERTDIFLQRGTPRSTHEQLFIRWASCS